MHPASCSDGSVYTRIQEQRFDFVGLSVLLDTDVRRAMGRCRTSGCHRKTATRVDTASLQFSAIILTRQHRTIPFKG